MHSGPLKLNVVNSRLYKVLIVSIYMSAKHPLRERKRAKTRGM